MMNDEPDIQVATEGDGDGPGGRSAVLAHDFTLPQLFAILVLRQFTRNDYRGIVAMHIDWPTLCSDMQLAKVPHFTTLHKAERRLLCDALIRRLLA
jgi:hypothetical protein